jgi:hypothetical protein
MLGVISRVSRFIRHNAECHCAECQYTECHYAECRCSECRDAVYAGCHLC